MLGFCYGLNTSLSSTTKPICWSPNPQVMTFGGGVSGRSLGHEHGILMNGTGALIRKHKREMTTCHGRVLPEGSHMQSRKRTLTRHCIISTWFRTSQPPELWEICLLFMAPNPWFFCYSSPSWLRNIMNTVCLCGKNYLQFFKVPTIKDVRARPLSEAIKCRGVL